jgi:hypothetical protein
LISRRPNTRHDAPVGACGISQVSWRSVPCLCPAPRPRPSRQDLALAILSVLPPVYPNRRPQRAHNLEADTGLQHPLSTLRERRRRHPCKTRFRLAGCASTGRASNPLDRCERFQVTFPSSPPGLALSQVDSSRNPTPTNSALCDHPPCPPLTTPANPALTLPDPAFTPPTGRVSPFPHATYPQAPISQPPDFERPAPAL